MTRALIPMMATVLAAEVIELADKRRCVDALFASHFHCDDILECLGIAQELARDLRAAVADQPSRIETET